MAMPDERLGERACAFVTLLPRQPSFRFGELQRFLDAHEVSKHYWPERLEVDRGDPPQRRRQDPEIPPP